MENGESLERVDDQVKAQEMANVADKFMVRAKEMREKGDEGGAKHMEELATLRYETLESVKGISDEELFNLFLKNETNVSAKFDDDPNYHLSNDMSTNVVAAVLIAEMDMRGMDHKSGKRRG